MLMRRVWIIALLAACGGSSTQPQTLDDVAGSYQLAMVGSKALPAYLHESVIDPNYGPQFIVGGSFTISQTGGDTREATRVEVIQNGTSGTWKDTIITPGAITLNVDDPRDFVFISGITPLHGTISRQRIILNTPGEAGARSYTR